MVGTVTENLSTENGASFFSSFAWLKNHVEVPVMFLKKYLYLYIYGVLYIDT